MIALLGLVTITIVWLIDQYQYQTLVTYKCDERREYVIPRQNLIPQDMLELYVGGVDRKRRSSDIGIAFSKQCSSKIFPWFLGWYCFACLYW